MRFKKVDRLARSVNVIVKSRIIEKLKNLNRELINKIDLAIMISLDLL